MYHVPTTKSTKLATFKLIFHLIDSVNKIFISDSRIESDRMFEFYPALLI